MPDQENQSSMRRATAAIHRGGLARAVYGEVSVPIFQTSTFSFPSAEAGAARFIGEEPGFIYTRMGNPTVQALEEGVAALEQGAVGHAAATGMAAIAAGMVPLGILLAVVGILLMILVGVISSALDGILIGALYIYAAEGEVPRHFDNRLLRDAFGAE